MKVNIMLTKQERTLIIAALMAYGLSEFAHDINALFMDSADDGPEVSILSANREAQS